MQEHQRSSAACTMDATELEREFWRLCEIVNSADTVEAGVPDLEPLLLEILSLVTANPHQRDVLVMCFSALVDGSCTYTDWIVLFCMRDLRWPEVQATAKRRFELAGCPPRLMNWISHINWAYDDSPWEDAVFFLYFWQKEHPGEPWPCQPQLSHRREA
jgi:hypothetical protein